MLKNQFFQHFYFGSKLADFWYSGVFEHEKSIGVGPEFQQNFFDPLPGYMKIFLDLGTRVGSRNPADPEIPMILIPKMAIFDDFGIPIPVRDPEIPMV